MSHQQVESYWMPLLETFIARGSAGYLVHNVPLWFVSCLFMMEMIYYFLADMKRVWIIITAIVMAAVSYCTITYCEVFDFTTLPWNVETAMLGIPFYAAGHWAVQKWGHQGMMDWVRGHRSVSWAIVVVSVIIVIFGGLYNGSISFGHNDLGKNVFIAYGCAFLGVIMMLMFCMLIGEMQFRSVGKKLIDWLIWFGRNSFTAMAIHNPIKGILCMMVGVLFHCGSSAVSLNNLYSFIAFIGTLVVSIIGIFIINWMKNLLSKK